MGFFTEKFAKFIAHGNELFAEMTANYHSLFVGQDMLLNFDIIDTLRDAPYDRSKGLDYCYIREYKEKYGAEIQKELISWIHAEKESIFKRENWRPLPEYDWNDMSFGYRKLFEFREHHFQLSIGHVCWDCVCSDEEVRYDVEGVYFQLVFWCEDKVKNSRFVKDNLLTGGFWEDKSITCADKPKPPPRIEIIYDNHKLFIGEPEELSDYEELT